MKKNLLITFDVTRFLVVMSKLRLKCLQILRPSEKTPTLLTVSHGPISHATVILCLLSSPTSFMQSDLSPNSNFRLSLHTRVLIRTAFPQVTEQEPSSHLPHPVDPQWLGQSLCQDHINFLQSTMIYNKILTFYKSFNQSHYSFPLEWVIKSELIL